MSLMNLIIQINIHSTNEEKPSQNNSLNNTNIYLVLFNDTKERYFILKTLSFDLFREFFNCLDNSHLYYDINIRKTDKSFNFHNE